jgi:hypothetical protein
MYSSTPNPLDSSSRQAIDSSSVGAIDSSSILGIDSSSVYAIDSSSANAIDSSSRQAIDSSSVGAIDSSSLLLAGPISTVNLYDGYFSSMGQNIYSSSQLLLTLRPGDYVMVGGQISGAGTIEANAVVRLGMQYIPGSTEVFVTGIPSSVDASLGLATIGGLEVDYTQSMANSDFKGIGAAVTVIGTQPALGGKMIGSQVQDKTELFLRD